MMKNYSICGLNLLADFRHDIMTARSEKYLTDETAPDMILRYDEEGIADIMKRGNVSIHSAENMLTADIFYTALLNFNGFMLHSSAVAVDGRAYLFSAPSGTGKSTHTGLWLGCFGERAQIINDDKPAIRIEKDGIFAYGTPWSGKSDLNINQSFPLQGICVLERSEKNFIEPLEEGTAIFSILDQTIRPHATQDMEKLLALLDKVISEVSVWRMGCNISVDAAKMAYEKMSETSNKGI